MKTSLKVWSDVGKETGPLMFGAFPPQVNTVPQQPTAGEHQASAHVPFLPDVNPWVLVVAGLFIASLLLLLAVWYAKRVDRLHKARAAAAARNNNKTQEQTSSFVTHLSSPYSWLLLVSYGMVFSALVLNMKFMFSSLHFQHPLFVSTVNVTGPVLMATWMLYRSEEKEVGGAGGNEESFRQGMRRAFRDKSIWVISFFAIAGILVGGNIESSSSSLLL